MLRTLDRVSKTITVLLSPTEVAFVANPNSPDSLQVWAVLAAVSECDVVRKPERSPARPSAPSASLCGSRVLRPSMLVQTSADGDAVFQTFRIESRNGNKIGFETDLAQFQRAIKVPRARA